MTAIVVFKSRPNHPSIIEPYGGANTGIGGVIRDPMGTGLGANLLQLTSSVSRAEHFPRILAALGVASSASYQGVVAGVRDYGNHGHPTQSRSILIRAHEPLVYCGNAGLLPVDKMEKKRSPVTGLSRWAAAPGRDGIHGDF